MDEATTGWTTACNDDDDDDNGATPTCAYLVIDVVTDVYGIETSWGLFHSPGAGGQNGHVEDGRSLAAESDTTSTTGNDVIYGERSRQHLDETRPGHGVIDPWVRNLEDLILVTSGGPYEIVDAKDEVEKRYHTSRVPLPEITSSSCAMQTATAFAAITEWVHFHRGSPATTEEDK
jgi:hypothetical protein